MEQEERNPFEVQDDDIANQWSSLLPATLKPELWVRFASPENEHAELLLQVWRAFCLHQELHLALQDGVAPADPPSFRKMFRMWKRIGPCNIQAEVNKIAIKTFRQTSYLICVDNDDKVFVFNIDHLDPDKPQSFRPSLILK
jgi:hypothetical protein